MTFLRRLTMWLTAAGTAFSADLITKAVPHTVVIRHYAPTSATLLIVVGFFLFALGVSHSNTLAVGAGCMFGGLCGNGGQLLLYGYASDWIPIGGWLTNVADIAGALGLMWCSAGYFVSWRARH